MSHDEPKLTSVEICAGAGGQAVGVHDAGFRHLALIELDKNACDTLELNVASNDDWSDCAVLRADLKDFNIKDFAAKFNLEKQKLDLFAGGVPCPPFSAAGKQLGEDDERDLFPKALEWVEELEPKAVMIENVRGLLEPPQKFRDYRSSIERRLIKAGYEICGWQILEACDYGVPQLRPRAILVAMRKEYWGYFVWPEPHGSNLVTVGDALAESMRRRFGSSARGRKAYKKWLEEASRGIAPTLVGGSKKHGGADLGPSRAKEAWRKLGVDGLGVANEPEKMVDEERDLFGPRGPKLTVSQAAIIQGFPPDWCFSGRKTAAYRQVGNAFPPPVAKAVAEQIKYALIAGMANPYDGDAMPQQRCHPADGLFDERLISLPKPTHSSRDLERACVG
ncbi:DNA cytosine methyltransferase [Streptomyces litchfieldiae]|uniref:Cytosine-specific methyltransferase n=1 Tax=Streptomyces litchfieldiae TaxID=3075543 RepID=A0ABU2N159_9ACTN|nr:DNA (cytosine-5-)-methyltransferase [Streptomyces sp. DSM 44938]MDT0347646.1 DNA (cytosine-5-)-methyltransferase [Streptomyces sp. DSM 44938]